MSEPLCPSAHPTWSGAIALGVIGGTAKEPSVRYLLDAQPVTQELLNLADPVTPPEVFRFAAPCLNGNCVHFKENTCKLASRVVTLLTEVSDDLPRCPIRATCQWWRQEGLAACRRCSQVVTNNFSPSDDMRATAQDPQSDPKARSSWF